jgi:hypothetical protein
MAGATPIGLVDLIDGHPEAGTVFVGLLAIAEGMQRAGWGRRAFGLVERFADIELSASRLRLAVVASNPVSGFWRRMGFIETGETRAFEGEARKSSIALMEKRLPSAQRPS